MGKPTGFLDYPRELPRDRIPLAKWALAFHLMAASKKGVSAKQVQRMLGLTYKSAWFMCHRIREAMSPNAKAGPLAKWCSFTPAFLHSAYCFPLADH